MNYRVHIRKIVSDCAVEVEVFRDDNHIKPFSQTKVSEFLAHKIHGSFGMKPIEPNETFFSVPQECDDNVRAVISAFIDGMNQNPSSHWIKSK